MNTYHIALAYLRANLATSLLHITLMMLGMAMMCALLLFGNQVQGRLFNDAKGIDVVIGAKGSPLQLILSSVQHMDIPTGNIPFSSLEKIQRNHAIREAIPLALGDNVKGFRIVGTEPAYFNLFHAELAAGTHWNAPMEAVAGARAAKEAGLELDKNFVGSHGLIPSNDLHTDHPYKLVGVLKPTGTVIDRLVLTPLASVWAIHEDHDEDEKHEETYGFHDITAIVASYSNRAAALSFPRTINRDTNLQAASPSFEIAKLMELVGMGTDTVMIGGGFLVGVSLLSVFIGLLTAIRARCHDLSILRVLGASRSRLLQLVITEGMLVALIGSTLGLMLGHGLLEWIGTHTAKGLNMGLHGFIFLPEVFIVWVIVLVLSFFACLIPAWEAYRTPLYSALRNT